MNICHDWNYGQCTKPCPHGLRHQCAICGGNHPAQHCQKGSKGQGKSKDQGKSKGKGKEYNQNPKERSAGASSGQRRGQRGRTA